MTKKTEGKAKQTRAQKVTWQKFIEGPLKDQVIALMKKKGSGIHCIVKDAWYIDDETFLLCILVNPEEIKNDQVKILGAEYINTSEIGSFVMLAPPEKEESLIALPSDSAMAEAKQQAQEMKRMK